MLELGLYRFVTRTDTDDLQPGLVLRSRLSPAVMTQALRKILWRLVRTNVLASVHSLAADGGNLAALGRVEPPHGLSGSRRTASARWNGGAAKGGEKVNAAVAHLPTPLTASVTTPEPWHRLSARVPRDGTVLLICRGAGVEDGLVDQAIQ